MQKYSTDRHVLPALTSLPASEDSGQYVLETLRVLRLADPSFDMACQLSFDPGTIQPTLAWQSWLAETFSENLIKLLTKIIKSSEREHAYDILETDRKLDSIFDETATARSRILGWRLLVDFRPPGGTRALGKMRLWALTDGLSPHFATVFATRCGIFNIPVPQAVAAYLFKEWHCGHCGSLPLGCLPPACPAVFVRHSKLNQLAVH